MPEIFIAFSYKDVLYLLQAALVTIALCAMAFSCGLVVALAIGLMRTARRVRVLRFVAAAYVEVFRGTPLLMQIFIAYFGLSIIGLQLPKFVAVSIPLILFTGAFMGEIVRPASRPSPAASGRRAGRWHVLRAGHALGRRPHRRPDHDPPSVGFLVQLVKGTSLAYVVGYVELTRAGYIVSQATYATMLVFTLVGLIYFGINYPLSLASQRLEAR